MLAPLIDSVVLFLGDAKWMTRTLLECVFLGRSAFVLCFDCIKCVTLWYAIYAWSSTWWISQKKVRIAANAQPVFFDINYCRAHERSQNGCHHTRRRFPIPIERPGLGRISGGTIPFSGSRNCGNWTQRRCAQVRFCVFRLFVETSVRERKRLTLVINFTVNNSQRKEDRIRCSLKMYLTSISKWIDWEFRTRLK